MNEINIAQAIQQRQAQFIENRTIIETQVNTFLQSLKNCTPDVIALFPGVFMAEGVSAKTLLPALWEEPFNIETYNAQLAEFKRYEAVVHDIYQKLNEEALKCLSE